MQSQLHHADCDISGLRIAQHSPEQLATINGEVLLDSTIRDSTEGLTPPTPPPPPIPPRTLDSPLPPPLPERKYTMADEIDLPSSPSPPPLPERRYLEDNSSLGVNWSQPPFSQGQPRYMEVGAQCSSTSNDSHPPPIPERTALSEQLVSPSSNSTTGFTFPAGGNQPSMTKPEEPKTLLGRYIVTEAGTRHLLLYNEQMAYAETVIDTPKSMSSRALPPEPPSAQQMKEKLRAGLTMPASTSFVHPEPEYDVAGPPGPPDPATLSPLYDEAVVPETASGQKGQQATAKGSKGQPVVGKGLKGLPVVGKELKGPSDTTQKSNPMVDEEDPRYDLAIHPSITASADPKQTKSLTLPSQTSLPKRVEAYEVVPLHSGAAAIGEEEGEKGLMQVDHRLQKKRAKELQRLAQNAQAHMRTVQSDTPPPQSKPPPRISQKPAIQVTSPERVVKSSANLTLPPDCPPPPPPSSPKKNAQVKDDLALAGSPSHQPTQGVAEYDILQHSKALQRLNVTLPRHTSGSPTYSQLNLTQAELLQRAIAGKPDLSNKGAEATIPIPQPQRPQHHHEYDTCGVKDTQGSDHDLDAPSLVWDNSDLQTTQKTSASTSPTKPVLSHRPLGGDIISQTPPSGLTDEDVLRREKRLDHHRYTDLDIREWPAGAEDLSLAHFQASEIKAVVRDSWNTSSHNMEDLPKGWTREVNEQGQVFYWHIPTGQIQYTRPVATDDSPHKAKPSVSVTTGQYVMKGMYMYVHKI